MSIVVTGNNEIIGISSSQSSTAYTYMEKSPFGIAHSYGIEASGDSYGYSIYSYGFVEHTLKEGTIHVS